MAAAKKNNGAMKLLCRRFNIMVSLFLSRTRSEVLAGLPGILRSRCAAPSTPRRALGVDVDGIHRSAGGHEQAVAAWAAETQIGAAFGQIDAADQLAVRIEDLNTVQFLAAHAPAAPEIAVDVAA